MKLLVHAAAALVGLTVLWAVGWILTLGELNPTDLSGGNITNMPCAHIEQLHDTVSAMYAAPEDSGHGQQLSLWKLDREHKDLTMLELQHRVDTCP